jgi:TonB family protein
MPPAPPIVLSSDVPRDLPAPVPGDPSHPRTLPTGLEVTGGGGRASDFAGILGGPPSHFQGDRGEILTAMLVDEPASVLDPRRPRYPRALEAARASGQVVLEFVVDTSGRAEAGGVRIVSSSHVGFEAPAREAVLGTRFRPGRLRGMPVRQLVRQTISFVAGP